MPITLASRQIIVERMDKQFNDDLRMRKDTNVISKAPCFSMFFSQFYLFFCDERNKLK